MKKLTNKEKEIMDLYWQHGPMFVRELQEHYADPKPHFNTLSTVGEERFPESSPVWKYLSVLSGGFGERVWAQFPGGNHTQLFRQFLPQCSLLVCERRESLCG